MSDLENEKIILRVELDQESAQKQLEETVKKILANKDAVASLNKEYDKSKKGLGVYQQLMTALDKELKSGKINTEQHAKAVASLDKQYAGAKQTVENYAKESVKLKIESKALSDEQRALVKSMGNVKQQQESAAGSVNQLRAQLSDLTKAYNALSKEERENGKAGLEIQKQAKAISDELKKLESAVGDNRRSVGDYTGGILKAVDGTGLLATITTKAKEGQELYTATLTTMKAGLGANVDMLGKLKFALAATGIGAVVLLLGGLVAWLTKTQEGLDWLSQKTAAVTTIISALTDRLSDAGEAVIDFFSGIENFGDLITKIGGLIQENLINRVKAFAIVWEGIQNFDGKKVGDGLLQMGTGVEDVAGKTRKLAKELLQVGADAQAVEKEFQRIRDAERALNVERAQANKFINEQRVIANDATKSTRERLEATQKASAKETELLEKETKLQEAKVANTAKEINLTKSLTKDYSKLAEEEVKLANLQAASAGKQVELQGKIGSLLNEAAAKKAAQAKEEEDRREKATELELRGMKAAAEYRLLQAQKGSEAELEARVELLHVEKNIALKNKDQIESERVVITEKALKAELELRRDFALNALEEAKKLAAEFEKRTNDEYSQQQKATADHFAQLTLDTTRQYADGLITEQEYNQQLEEIKRESLEKQLTDAQDYGRETLTLQQVIADEEAKTTKAAAEEKVRIKQAEYELISGLFDAAGSLVTLAAKQGEEAAGFHKALALFQVAVDTAMALSDMIQKSIKSSLTPFDAAAKVIAAVAFVLGQFVKVKALLKDEPPKAKFREGTVLEGPSHEAGGIDLYSRSGHYYGEAEGGEIVLTKGVKRDPLLFKFASLLNVAGGGKPLTPAAYLKEGGIMQQGSAKVARELEQDYRKMAQEIAKEMAQVVPRSIAVTQIERALETKAQVRQAGTWTSRLS